jgi:small GTP-binding protein
MEKVKKLDCVPEKYEKILKIVLIGDKGVGKTSFLKKYTDGIFNEKYEQTVGSEMKICYYSYNNKIIKIHFCDIAGHEKYRSLINTHCKNMSYIIVLFDVCNEDSFINIRDWMKDIEKYKKENTQMILVGNKSDQHTDLQKINDDLGYALADELGCQYIKASAKNNINVDKVFELFISGIEI